MKNKIKILIAEHDAVDLELMHHELKLGGIDYISETVDNEKVYTMALQIFIPDIILCDYNFPSFDGPAAFKIRQRLAPDTPFIFVSGTIGEEKSIELIKNGVTDYALKDKLFTLCPKVIRALKEANELQQKKKTEQELVQSESRLARAQQIAHLGSWELNFATNIVRWSDEACNIYGLAPGQNLQSFETAVSFIHPEDADIELYKVAASRNSLSDFSSNYRIVRSNGSVRHIYSESKLEFDLNGKPTGLHGIMQDVTEKDLLEQEMAEVRRAKQSEITAAVMTAQETQRAAIGGELHENLNQILGAAKLYIDMAKTDETNRKMFLDKSSEYIVTVIEEIRKISKTLSSPGKELGLFNSINILLDDIISVPPVKILFFENDVKEMYLNEKLQLTIFRIVQEQVNNILKHAKATQATISLSRQENEVALFISDNGKGTDILNNNDGVGIKNIMSRADLHNGKVTVVSKPGDGYKLKVVLSMDCNIDKIRLQKVMPV